MNSSALAVAPASSMSARFECGAVEEIGGVHGMTAGAQLGGKGEKPIGLPKHMVKQHNLSHSSSSGQLSPWIGQGAGLRLHQFDVSFASRPLTMRAHLSGRYVMVPDVTPRRRYAMTPRV